MFYEEELYQQDIAVILKAGYPWEKLFGKTVLITGATGMIGTVLVDVLMCLNRTRQGKINILALGRNEESFRGRFAEYLSDEYLTFVRQDVNESFAEEIRGDFYFHCASNTHPKAYSLYPVETVLTNIIGTRNVLESARKCGAQRTVFLSSVEIYGENTAGEGRWKEHEAGYIDCNTLRAGYPEGKRAGEALCQAYREQYGMDIVIPRICRVYGPTLLRSDSKALSQFLANAVAGEDIVLKSEGMQYYSYCYVADVVSALLAVLLLGTDGEAYNIADEASDIRLKDLASIIAEAGGRKVVFQLPDAVERKGFSKATLALLDSTKIRELGWSAEYTIRQGLQRTVAMMRRSHID